MALPPDIAFVFVGLQSWDTDIGSNARNLALELSRHHRVLFVNAPLDRATKMKSPDKPEVQRRIAAIGQPAKPIEAGPNLWHYYPTVLLESINWIKYPWLFDWANRVNNKRMARTIQAACQALGFQKIILINDNELYRAVYLAELLQPVLSVYYLRDYLLGVPYWQRHGTRLEPLVIQKASLVAANSHYLRDYAAQYNPNSHYVGQGVELDLFDPMGTYMLAADLRPITLKHKPIIGYVGALASLRLDIGLLEQLAQDHPEWSLVLVGPPDQAFRASKLNQMDNVYFLGRKDPAQLPGYVRHFDVCINPQVVNNVTIGNYPRKVDEYLAMGKPVVATKTPAMDIFLPHVYLAENAAQFAEHIATALDEVPGQYADARMALAQSHSWENSVGLLLDAIEQTLDKTATA